MSTNASIRVHTFRRASALTLSGGGAQATFMPSLGMLGTSFRLDGEEFVDLHGGLDAFRHWHTTGIPLLYPWANRLNVADFELLGNRIDLGNVDHPTDPNGLPIHGLLLGARTWEIVRAEATGNTARATLRFDFNTRKELSNTYPFAHFVDLEIVVDGGLTVITTVTPTGDHPVPIAFGFHPYFHLPRARRDSVQVNLPEREHLLLDDQMIPTGSSRAEAAQTICLKGRSFDDAYQLVGDPQISIESTTKKLTIHYLENYPYAQVYAPRDQGFVAVEPMTAPTNALVDGRFPVAEPGSSFTAAFRVTAETS